MDGVMLKRLLITLCLSFMLVATTYALPPMPMGWGGDDRIEFIADGTISTIAAFANKYITNQGASGEVDVMLPAVSWPITLYFIVEETQVIEVNPPTGEAFIFSTATLHANDVIDSDNVVGSMLMVTRIKNAAGAWQWLAMYIIGTWVDGDATD